jgi:hypothetical protein
MILTSPPAPLSQFRRDVPEELERVLAKGLAKDRNERYADIAAFARALAPFGGAGANERAARVNDTAPADAAHAVNPRDATVVPRLRDRLHWRRLPRWAR